MAVRAITQKKATFFIKNAGMFEKHDVTHGITHHDNYKNLFNLVTHSDRRESMDSITKNIFSCMMVKLLRHVGYFDASSSESQGLFNSHAHYI